MKNCTKCNKKLTTDHFYKSSKKKDGFRSECKECSHMYSRKGYIKRKQKTSTKSCKFCGNTVNEDKYTFCSNSCARKYKFQNETNHPMYKGEEKNNSAIHRWIDKKRGGKPDKCDFCGENPGLAKNSRNMLEWSNISGQYKRDISDWQCLCVKCHRNYDKTSQERPRDQLGRFT